jgi:threonine dehydrogenase-like Zn-dependent dehydrogenase
MQPEPFTAPAHEVTADPMKQVNIHAPGDVRVDEVPEPEVGPGDALVEVAACGICGSDLGYIKQGGLAGPTGQLMPLGHELSGVVAAVGADVKGIEVGARVVVNPIAADNMIGNGGPEGAFAPLLLVRNVDQGPCLQRIPDALDLDLAALAEPLGVGMQSVERVDIRAGEKVVVFGAGPIGLAAIATLHHRGVEDVIAVDLSARRLEIASKLGARLVVNAADGDPWETIREAHGTSPVMGMPMAATDAYIEASGAAPVVSGVLANACSKARLSVVALHHGDVPVNFILLMMKQLNISGSMAYPDDWTPMLEMLVESDLSPMITHRFPLDAWDQALATAQDPAAGGKVIIEF